LPTLIDVFVTPIVELCWAADGVGW